MTRARIAAAAAAILTLLLLQAALVGPVVGLMSGSAAVSLPAVAVAAVAFVDGPATGMSFGFAAGLMADLGSAHPAGVLALCWLGIGLLCGRVADQHTVRHDAVWAGIVCGLGGAAVTVVLGVLHARGSVSTALVGLVPSIVGDAVLAFAVVAITRRMLSSDSLRRPSGVYTELLVGGSRG